MLELIRLLRKKKALENLHWNVGAIDVWELATQTAALLRKMKGNFGVEDV